MWRWGSVGKRGQAKPSPRRREDRELADRVRYDPEAFGALYDRHFRRTYRLIYRRVGNHALAQDLTARVFFRALRLIKGHRHASSSFSSWLRTLALMMVARSGYPIARRRQGPATDQGLQSAGCPAPLLPTRPTLSAAAAAPLPPTDEGPGIVYALGR